MISVIFYVQMSMAGVKMFYIDSCFIVVVGFCAECTDTFHSRRHWNSSSSSTSVVEVMLAKRGGLTIQPICMILCIVLLLSVKINKLGAFAQTAHGELKLHVVF